MFSLPICRYSSSNLTTEILKVVEKCNKSFNIMGNRCNKSFNIMGNRCNKSFNIMGKRGAWGWAFGEKICQGCQDSNDKFWKFTPGVAWRYGNAWN